MKKLKLPPFNTDVMILFVALKTMGILSDEDICDLMNGDLIIKMDIGDGRIMCDFLYKVSEQN